MKTRNTGQGLIEYALIIAIVIVGLLVVLRLTGVNLRDAYCQAARSLGVQACSPTKKIACQDTFDSSAPGSGEEGNKDGKDKGDDDHKDGKGAIPGWDTSKGKWSLQDGKMCGGPGEGRIYNACSQALSASDYTVSLNSAVLDKGNGYGIYFRTSEGKYGINGYTFQYDPGYGRGAFIFRKWVNGHELRPFAVAPADNNFSWHDTPHDIQLVLQGNTFTAYVDGQPVVTGTDDSYATGGAGLRTWDGSNLCVDDFTIQR
ncbi:MAG: hypothetical protein Fur0018_02710 [Anaerolineales bacterium]